MVADSEPFFSILHNQFVASIVILHLEKGSASFLIPCLLLRLVGKGLIFGTELSKHTEQLLLRHILWDSKDDHSAFKVPGNSRIHLVLALVALALRELYHSLLVQATTHDVSGSRLVVEILSHKACLLLLRENACLGHSKLLSTFENHRRWLERLCHPHDFRNH